MIERKRKSDSFLFKGESNCKTFKKILGNLIRESAIKASNYGKYLIFLVTVLFIREEWLRLLVLLKTGLLRQISSEKLLQISKKNL